MGQELELVKGHILEGATLSPGQRKAVVDAIGDGTDAQAELILAVLALSEVGLEWPGKGKVTSLRELTALQRLFYVTQEQDYVEGLIDGAMDAYADAYIDAPLKDSDAALAADALVRAGVPWAHEALVGLLTDEDASMASAWLLAQSDGEELEQWLNEAEVVEEAFPALRAIALAQAPDLWDVMVAWHRELGSVNDKEANQRRQDLHALLAALDPPMYARGLLMGEYEMNWLLDSVSVADFLQTRGVSDWLETLAILEQASARTPFEFAALLAVSASAGVSEEEGLDEEIEALLDAQSGTLQGDETALQDLSNSGEFGFQIALGEDDDLADLLVEAAIHERLRMWDQPSFGIASLPLSATCQEWLEVADAEAFFGIMGDKDELADEEVVALVRTICDLRQWELREPAIFGPLVTTVRERFGAHSNPAVALAAASLDAAAAPQGIAELEETARAQTVSGLEAVRRLVEVGSDEAQHALARLWAEGPVARAPFYADALAASVLEGGFDD